MKSILFILLTSMGCASTNAPAIESNKMKNQIIQSSNQKQEVVIKDLKIEKKTAKTADELRFKIKKIVQRGDGLMVDLTYGGGCVENHVFELSSTGKTDENGVMDLTLLHKTTEDKCKMLLMRTEVFNIGKLANKRNFTKFRINGGDVITAVQAK